jgi:sterol desaturase/sphingolipid hydroxylase (fatty acid hydroxylase superfamily)
MGYWNHDASLERTQKAVSRDARHAMEKSLKQELAAKTLRRKRPKNVPKRGRMIRQVLQVPTTRKERGFRAAVGALLFGLIGGAIALFAAGMPFKGKPPPEKMGAVGVAWVITLCLFIAGGIIGWFIGGKKGIVKNSDKYSKPGEEH